MKRSGRKKKRLAGQMLAPSAPVLLQLVSGEIWTLKLHLGRFLSAFREMQREHFLPRGPAQCGLLLGWEYLVLSHSVPHPHRAEWHICRSEAVILLKQLNPKRELQNEEPRVCAHSPIDYGFSSFLLPRREVFK